MRLEASERVATRAKRNYETAQANLRTAISSADRAELAMRDAQQRVEIDQNDEAREEHARAVANYAAAGDVRSAAMTVNARALTTLADADVEVIRNRIARDRAAVGLDEANAACARAERELREAREAIDASNAERKKAQDVVAQLEGEARLARRNLERVELVAQEATEENAAAQTGLKDVQDGALRSGEETRVAADTLDERRRRLSDCVSAVERARNALVAAKRTEEECASRLDAAQTAYDAASATFFEAKSFIEDAERRMGDQREEIRRAEAHVTELTSAYRRADEELSTAQRELDVAHSDLTDAEVSVIMAEIDSRAH
jgi:chromosome segregation ATPase